VPARLIRRDGEGQEVGAMMYWGNGMGGWAMAAMTIGNLLFWGAIITGVVLVVRSFGRTAPEPTGTARPTAQALLAERYARGEIDDDEYARRLQVLGSSTGS
jgi:putative membrane protein